MGKVHGSLARAGKVKSQTPKVRYHSPSAGARKRSPPTRITTLATSGATQCTNHPCRRITIALGEHK